MKDKIRLLLAGVLFGGALFFALRAGEEELPYLLTRMENARLARTFLIPEEEVSGDGENEGHPLNMQVDFAGLKKENGDIIGWIYIPGTQINYPIMQHKTVDTYYLHHAAGGEANQLGAIFLYSTAASDFSDAHTVLFGHNMRSGQMFGELSSYAEKDFAESHPCVYIYLPQKTLEYTIYSAYACAVSDPVYTPGYRRRTEEFRELIRHTKDSSVWKSALSPAEEAVLTLSTCTDDGEARRRFVVNGIETKRKEYEN